MTAINDKYVSLGGASGWLGAALGPELLCPDLTGHFRHYQNGSIYWHPDAGAHEVHGLIRERWKSLGWELSWLGYPVTDELDAVGGKISRFQAGAISWQPNRGAWDHPAEDFVERHERTHAEHQADYNALLKQGWRMISLCVYGDVGDPRYASIWVRRDGLGWSAIHGASATQFQAWVKTERARGLHPTLVTAIGDDNKQILAGVAEAVPETTFRQGLRGGDRSPEDFGWWNAWARRNHQILTCVAAYGSAKQPRYAAIWRPNPANVVWDVLPELANGAVEQARFDAHLKHRARPVISARHAEGGNVSVYHNDSMGPWTSRGEMTAAAYAAECSARDAEGYVPITVQAGGHGSGARFTAVFAKRDTPLPSRFVATGVAVPSMSGIDLAVEGFMRRNNIPAGGVAVAKDGRLVYARGFTFGPSTAPLTTPASLLRIGSCSKVLTSLLIHWLADERADFSLNSWVKAVLDLPPPSNLSFAPEFNGITIEQLLRHTSGMQNDFASLDEAIIAAHCLNPAQAGCSLPLTNKQWVAAYLMTLALETPPGARTFYSNAGFALLCAVIEKLSGASWFRALRAIILRPLGISRPQVSGSLVEQPAPGEMHYQDWGGDLTASIMSPDRPLVRWGYGDVNLGVGDGVGGMAFAPADFVRILVALRPGANRTFLSEPIGPNWGKAAGWASGTTQRGVAIYDHTGGLPNAHAYVAVRDDGVALTTAFAKGGSASWPGPRWNDLLDAVQAWPNHDLFDSVGLRPDV